MRCVCACLCVGISNLHTIYIYCLVVFYMCTKIKLLFVHTHALHTPYPTKPPQNRNSHHQPNQINWIHISICFFYSLSSSFPSFRWFWFSLFILMRSMLFFDFKSERTPKFIFRTQCSYFCRPLWRCHGAWIRMRQPKNVEEMKKKLINKTDSSLTVNRYGAKKKEKLKIIRSVFVDTINVHSHRLHTKLWNGKKMNVYRATTCTIYSSSNSHTKLKNRNAVDADMQRT